MVFDVYICFTSACVLQCTCLFPFFVWCKIEPAIPENAPTWNYEAELRGRQQSRVVALDLGVANQDIVPAPPVVFLSQAPQALPNAS